MPAARIFYLLAAVSALAVAGVLLPALGWLALGLDLLIAAAFAYDLQRARRRRLVARRTWPPLLAQGAKVEIVVELEGDPEAGLEVVLREVLHPALAPLPLRYRLAIPAGRRALWRYPLVPRRRGEHQVGPLVARLLGPWGLAWHQVVLLPAERRRVFPQVRWGGKVGHLVLLAHRRLLGQHPQRLQGAGSEVYALREYLRGDPPGKIHWKAAARHGRLITREETWEHGARLVILLDAARTMSGRDGERSKLDHALAAALALVRVARRAATRSAWWPFPTASTAPCGCTAATRWSRPTPSSAISRRGWPSRRSTSPRRAPLSSSRAARLLCSSPRWWSIWRPSTCCARRCCGSSAATGRS